MVNMILFLAVILAGNFSEVWSQDSEAIFTEIYQKGTWGGQWYSGGGAEIQHAQAYVQFLQNFLHTYAIKSVVDIGCGDWQFSKHINWNGISYLGIDVVEYLVTQNTQLFQRPNIKFMKLDVLQQIPPKADLLICKDILQHLTNEDIHIFLRHCAQFKYCLITNDVYPQTLSSHNPSIMRGQHRPIDLTKPPFNVKATRVLVYAADYGNMKMVLLIDNNK